MGATFFTVLGLLLLWGHVFVFLSPISETKLQRLNTGASSDAVFNLLGSPTSKNGNYWVYSKWWHLDAVYIHFDQQGAFKFYRID